jgi:hypothetical protein
MQTISPGRGKHSTVIGNGDKKLIVAACATAISRMPKTNSIELPVTHDLQFWIVWLQGPASLASVQCRCHAGKQYVADQLDLDDRQVG